MNDPRLARLRDLIQDDVGKRGLRADPERNLVSSWPDDFARSCASLAEHPEPALVVVTGFYIPTATPPAGETDGPLGALFLARALSALKIRVTLATDEFCVRAVGAGLVECGLTKQVPIITLPTAQQSADWSDAEYRRHFDDRNPLGEPTHLLAIERVGPTHADERCRTMRGRDITEFMSPAHRLFLPSPSGRGAGGEGASRRPTTIGIGDGGNEIGMGKIPWDVIERNIPNGKAVACKTATDHLIVCGVSNWGAYALSAGVAILRGANLDASLFDAERERKILEVMVKAGPLVDGVTGKPTATVDGLTWEQYVKVLIGCGQFGEPGA